MTPTIWNGCYDQQWAGLITKESFAHPAKFSRGLIERIFDHMLSRGWIAPGQTVGDPFGGVACGGIIAAYRGLEWQGVEIEEKFVTLGRSNITLHRHKLVHMGRPIPHLIQGDSRCFDELLSGTGAVVTSPPYAETLRGYPDGIDWVKAKPKANCSDKHRAPGASCHSIVGRTAGQIAALREGAVDSVVTSPPYGETLEHGGGPDTKHDLLQGGKSLLAIKTGYGNTEGQISPETYWQAMRDVYAACFRALKPGGYMAVVVKNYCKKGQIVPLCDDTLRLLDHFGFVPVERVHAMLTSQTRENDLFSGHTVTTRSRKSFFRRLAEKKGSPPIDFEEVLFVRKPSL